MSGYITASLADRWFKYTRELRKCQTGFSEKSVHDLRVALRRMISALDMAGAVVADRPLGRVRRELKRLLGNFSALRDVQVQLLIVEEMVSRHPQLAVIRTTLLVKEERLVDRLRKQITKVRTSDHAAAIQSLGASVERAFQDFSRARSRRGAVVATATAAFARAVQSKEMANRSRPETIHRLRVAFKKFRYRAEMLQPLLSWFAKDRLTAMNAYQTRMGEIQDIDVFLRVVRVFAARPRRRGSPPFRPVILELLARRRELIRRFFSSSAELYTFWSVAANAPHAAFARARRGHLAGRIV
jgi:CHAD domain-containing protein